MPLNPGLQIGPYQILAPLGAGGMGEVYRALDTRLNREVALKVLPAAFAADPGRQARFEQEARAAAALNHPNIVGIFDFGTHEGAAYIVSELVRGETLTDWIERGPIPLKKLLDIAVQVADGMAAAHAARIVHRDLKPANIMLGEDGRPKILDFGLARQAPVASPSPSAPDATATLRLTSAGMILGTVNYMSPEQARGREVDYRSDQFSFGLILYEMAAGKKAFERPESVQVMSAILTDEAPPLDPKLPAPLRWAIDRCLAKEPRDRYESTRDLFQELRHLKDHLSEATLAPDAAVPPAAKPGAAARPRRGLWKLLAAFAAGVLCAAGVALWRSGPYVADQASYRFTPLSFEAGGQCCAQWSPDGKAVAYSARSKAADPYQVYLRYLDSPVPLQLTHLPEDAQTLSWATDGKHILFTRAGVKPASIWSVSTVGGDPEAAFAFPDVKPFAISPDGRVYADLRAPDHTFGIWYGPPGGALRAYTPAPFASKDVFNSPQMAFSPDSKQLLLYLARDRQKEEAWLLPFPPDPSHPPRQVLKTADPQNGTPEFVWAPDNRHLVVAMALGLSSTQLWMADTQSETHYALTSGARGRGGPAISPDGKRLVFEEGEGSTAIVSVDLATAALHPLIDTDSMQMLPGWAAHAPVMAYVTDRNGPPEIWLHTNDGERPLVTGGDPNRWLMSPAPSPDGSRVAYTVIDRKAGLTHLWLIAAGGGAPVRMTAGPAFEIPGAWSPDGGAYVYLAVQNNKVDLMKVKTSGEARPTILKPDLDSSNGSIPVWSPTGEWIAYNDNGEKLISPDGSKSRELGNHKSIAYGFSADGKLLYGIRVEKPKVLLFSIDVANGNEKIIGDVGYGNEPRASLSPSLRLSLSPDGKSVTYSTARSKSNLWILDGWAK